MEKIIEVEADSLENARRDILSQLPPGFEVISERVIHEGGVQTAQGVAETVKKAFAQAQQALLSGTIILEKRVLVQPQEVSIEVEAFDESNAKLKAQKQLGDNLTVQGMAMLRSGSKGILGLLKRPGQYSVNGFQQAVVMVQYHMRAKMSATIAKLGARAEAVALAEKISGGWPQALNRHAFERCVFPKLLELLRKYQEMAHPGTIIREVSPSYQIINGSITRKGDTGEDFKIATVASFLQGRAIITPFDQRACAFAFEAIQKYGSMRLAKFLFLLPRAFDMVNDDNKTVVIEDCMIDVYKGVENLLFAIYEELPEGGVLTDSTVTEGLLALVNAAK